jgi:hypothetical protein
MPSFVLKCRDGGGRESEAHVRAHPTLAVRAGDDDVKAVRRDVGNEGWTGFWYSVFHFQ